MDVMISGRHYDTTSEISWLGQYDDYIWFRNTCILQYQMDQVPPKSWEFWSAS